MIRRPRTGRCCGAPTVTGLCVECHTLADTATPAAHFDSVLVGCAVARRTVRIDLPGHHGRLPDGHLRRLPPGARLAGQQRPRPRLSAAPGRSRREPLLHLPRRQSGDGRCADRFSEIIGPPIVVGVGGPPTGRVRRRDDPSRRVRRLPRPARGGGPGQPARCGDRAETGIRTARGRSGRQSGGQRGAAGVVRVRALFPLPRRQPQSPVATDTAAVSGVKCPGGVRRFHGVLPPGCGAGHQRVRSVTHRRQRLGRDQPHELHHLPQQRRRSGGRWFGRQRPARLGLAASARATLCHRRRQRNSTRRSTPCVSSATHGPASAAAPASTTTRSTFRRRETPRATSATTHTPRPTRSSSTSTPRWSLRSTGPWSTCRPGTHNGKCTLTLPRQEPPRVDLLTRR